MKLLMSILCMVSIARVGFAQARQPLDCSALQTRKPLRESATLRTAPHGARRPTSHRLIVKWSGGAREFDDVAPYGIGAEEGVRHFYCGYDPRTGMHLIYRYNEDEVDGVMLNDSTGVVLPAGYVVVFTPDHTRYLAVVQPDGMEGQEWRIYSRDGRLQTENNSLSCSAGYQCVQLANPRWSARGELTADAVCGNEEDPKTHRVPVRLSVGEAQWTSEPEGPCKSQ